MTVGQALIEWLHTYGDVEVEAVIETDQLDSETKSYGLFKEAQKEVVTFLNGSRDVTEYYNFMVRARSKLDTNRVSNQEWLENLETWIRMQNIHRVLPDLGPGRACWAVGVSVTGYMMEQETDTAAYQMSVEIHYTEE